MKRYAPIPLVQTGGIQPFEGSTPQIPGASLMAMLRGTTLGGFHPHDAQRAAQKAARKRPASLLDHLSR